MRIGQALALAAQHDLSARRHGALQRLVDAYLRNDNVRYLAVVDARGRLVASAPPEGRPATCSGLLDLPASVSMTRRTHPDLVTLAHPIVMQDGTGAEGTLAGSVRLVLDASATTARVKAVWNRISLVTAGIVLLTIPVGYLFVWRVLVLPVRKLVAVARRLGRGDFHARASLGRNDEIGELADEFDKMADQVAEMRDELEQKVAERTQELQLANRRLREEMAEKEDFLRAVSHDLNAPLRNIAGMTTLMMMKWREQLPEDVVARLQRIQANVDAGTLLIEELLELSRIQSQPQRRENVDMGRLIEDVAHTFEFELKRPNITLEIASPMPTLYVEKSRIRQVFQNLLDNAIKYMHRPSGGRIVVGYDSAEGCHRFHVADNGPGVPAEHQERIFHVFRRVAGAEGGQVEGKGVGLALVKSVAATYDGRAWVESDPGRGATFYFTLAVTAALPPAAGALRPAQESSDDQSTYHPVGR